jgi:Trk K+ transport system NAD-binding subunit
MVENLLDRPGLAQLYEFGYGAASLLDAVIPSRAVVAGKQIHELDIPEECLIAAIIRDNTFVVPRGDTRIEVDDRLVFIGPAAVIRKAADLMTVTKKK